MATTKGKAASHKTARHGKRIAKATRVRATKAALNLVDFEKTAFDNAAKVVGSVQEQTEKVLLDSLRKMGWMPKEAKDLVNEWVKLMRRSRADFTRTMDRSFGLVSGCIKRLNVEEPKAEAKAPRKARPRPRKVVRPVVPAPTM